jgi:predicted DNA-binding transcriptional regulator AlpA
MNDLNTTDREAILRLVRKEIRLSTRDAWLNATEASQYLKMSRHHFLKLCRNGSGPEGHGTSPRLRRWKISSIDAWMQHKLTSIPPAQGEK